MNGIVWPFLLPILTALCCVLFFGLPTPRRRLLVAASAAVQLGLALFLPTVGATLALMCLSEWIIHKRAGARVAGAQNL